VTRTALGAPDPDDEGDDNEKPFELIPGFKPDFGFSKIVENAMRPVWQAQMAPFNNLMKGVQADLGFTRIAEQISRAVMPQPVLPQILADLIPIYRPQPLLTEQLFANLNRSIFPDLTPFFEGLRNIQPADLDVDDEDETEEQRQLRKFLAAIWSSAGHYISFEQFTSLAPYLYLLALWAGAIYVIAGLVGTSQAHEDKALKEYTTAVMAAGATAAVGPTLKRRWSREDEDDEAA